MFIPETTPDDPPFTVSPATAVLRVRSRRPFFLSDQKTDSRHRVPETQKTAGFLLPLRSWLGYRSGKP